MTYLLGRSILHRGPPVFLEATATDLNYHRKISLLNLLNSRINNISSNNHSSHRNSASLAMRHLQLLLFWDMEKTLRALLLFERHSQNDLSSNTRVLFLQLEHLRKLQIMLLLYLLLEREELRECTFQPQTAELPSYIKRLAQSLLWQLQTAS